MGVANEKQRLHSSRRLPYDFVAGVANKKRRLRSSRRLPWSSRTGWQAVSTMIFEWLLNLWLKMWTNYPVVMADNLLEGRTNRMIFFSQTQCFKTQSKLPSMRQAQIWVTNVRWGGRTLSRVNAEYNYSRQLTLNTIVANKSVMTKFGWMEEDFVMQEITDNKSILQNNPSIEAPSVTCFGLVTCWV
jgi:hypothetical protein